MGRSVRNGFSAVVLSLVLAAAALGGGNATGAGQQIDVCPTDPTTSC